jgi:site-specific recombinase
VKLSRSIRKRLRLRKRSQQRPAFVRVDDELRARTKAFIAAGSLQGQATSFGRLFLVIWSASNERAFTVRLIRWIRLLEYDDLLRIDFQEAFQSMLSDLNSVSLCAEAGLPAHHAVFSEGLRRIVQRFLPSARAETDTSRLMLSLFSTTRDVERFIALPDYLFERLRALLWPSPSGADGSPKPTGRVQHDLRQALCLLATRTAGRGMTAAMRARGAGSNVEASPFYQLIFATENLAQADAPSTLPRVAEWKACVVRCREELDLVHQNMETSGVSADLVLDLRSIELALTRMGHLAELLEFPASVPPRVPKDASTSIAPEMERSRAVRVLLNELIHGRLEDKRLRSLLIQNLNLLARKTVERTGHSGEHYIAHSTKEYWQMWIAAFGGGLLTVLTAAIKMRIVDEHYPLFVEGLFSSLNYAISFILLQVFGLALATKQPSATAATFAGIVRRNRGYARWSKISDFTAHITRTQLAAAVANVIAVCSGAVAFERLWRVMFSESYLAPESAKHVYETLHPFTSGTIFFAAITGVLLWLAALMGGWCENFAVYHRIPAAISQHPFGIRVGERSMQRVSKWIELNLAGWSTSVLLGFLLGFVPVVARFFGIPMDVRHVTLSTGTLALAAARYGTSSFGHDWFYYAVAGIGATFVLNLSVSFFIAAFVALHAYDVRGREQIQLLRFLLIEIVKSPLKFLIPIETRHSRVTSIPELAEKE